MEKIEFLNIKKLSPDATLPTRAHPDDAGLDLYSLEDALIGPAEGRVVGTGIAVALPDGHVGLVMDRSSMAKKGIKTAGGIIDAGYRGEIKIVLWNLSKDSVRIARAERIAQLLVVPIQTPAVRESAELDSSHRGEKGFGSSGR